MPATPGRPPRRGKQRAGGGVVVGELDRAAPRRDTRPRRGRPDRFPRRGVVRAALVRHLAKPRLRSLTAGRARCDTEALLVIEESREVELAQVVQLRAAAGGGLVRPRSLHDRSAGVALMCGSVLEGVVDLRVDPDDVAGDSPSRFSSEAGQSARAPCHLDQRRCVDRRRRNRAFGCTPGRLDQPPGRPYPGECDRPRSRVSGPGLCLT
jgi:hypothetical protein